jgi:glycosyltransferase involved in cell wall biosynthesis
MASQQRVLQVGPLYNNHLARWSAHARALGCTVYAAGHVRPGRQQVDLRGLAEHVEVAPARPGECGTAQQVDWLRGVIRRINPDVVQAHWLATWGCYAALAAGRPCVATPWGSDVYLQTGAARVRADAALARADRVIARSPHMRAELTARAVRAERIHDVDLGVDLQRFRPATPAEQIRLRSELGLPRGPLILSTRAGTSLYNLDVLLDAFRLIRDRHDGATLVLVHGDAPLARRVRVRLRELELGGDVRVVGRIAHAAMPAYLRAATIAVSIPSSDGSPSSVWEALACGVPQVLSKLPPVGEKVRGCGAVRLVAIEPDSVAGALDDLLSDPVGHARAARAARAWAVLGFDEREQIARLGELYDAISVSTERPRSRAPARESAQGRRRARHTATAAAPPLRPS